MPGGLTLDHAAMALVASALRGRRPARRRALTARAPRSVTSPRTSGWSTTSTHGPGVRTQPTRTAAPARGPGSDASAEPDHNHVEILSTPRQPRGSGDAAKLRDTRPTSRRKELRPPDGSRGFCATPSRFVAHRDAIAADAGQAPVAVESGKRTHARFPGRVTSGCAARSPPWRTAPAGRTRGPPTATPTPAGADTTTAARRALSAAPGRGSSGGAGRATPLRPRPPHRIPTAHPRHHPQDIEPTARPPRQPSYGRLTRRHMCWVTTSPPFGVANAADIASSRP
jgi:hypothetical protein